MNRNSLQDSETQEQPDSKIKTMKIEIDKAKEKGVKKFLSKTIKHKKKRKLREKNSFASEIKNYLGNDLPLQNNSFQENGNEDKTVVLVNDNMEGNENRELTESSNKTDVQTPENVIEGKEKFIFICSILIF